MDNANSDIHTRDLPTIEESFPILAFALSRVVPQIQVFSSELLKYCLQVADWLSSTPITHANMSKRSWICIRTLLRRAPTL